MALDWDAIEKEAKEKGGNYKDWAENGEHEVKVESFELSDRGNGWFDFQFQEDEVKYPKLSVSFFGDDKVNFRAHYYKEMMVILGTTEENARKAVSVCEGKDSRAAIFKAYGEAFTRLANKHPKIKIEVRDQYDRDGNPVMSEKGTVYGESVFTQASGLQFSQKRNAQPANQEVVPEDIPEDGEDLLDSIPF